MKQAIRFGAVIGTVLTLSPSFASAINTSPGKKAVYASANSVLVSGTGTPLVSAQIAKGKKKHVLEIVGTSRGAVTGSANTLGIQVRVNGFTSVVEPNQGGFDLQLCSSSYFCSVSTHVFVDLDAAELANPGMFIGVPITIELISLVGTGSSTVFTSVQGRMVKK